MQRDLYLYIYIYIHIFIYSYIEKEAQIQSYAYLIMQQNRNNTHTQQQERKKMYSTEKPEYKKGNKTTFKCIFGSIQIHTVGKKKTSRKKKSEEIEIPLKQCSLDQIHTKRLPPILSYPLQIHQYTYTYIYKQKKKRYMSFENIFKILHDD